MKRLKATPAWGDWVEFEPDKFPTAGDKISLIEICLQQFAAVVAKLKRNLQRGLLTIRVHHRSGRISWVWQPHRNPKRICLR